MKACSLSPLHLCPNGWNCLQQKKKEWQWWPHFSLVTLIPKWALNASSISYISILLLSSKILSNLQHLLPLTLSLWLRFPFSLRNTKKLHGQCKITHSGLIACLAGALSWCNYVWAWIEVGLCMWIQDSIPSYYFHVSSFSLSYSSVYKHISPHPLITNF